MRFTYRAYKDLIKRLRSKQYELVGYTDYESKDKCAILRHDVDTSINKALELAALESQESVKSTYFFLLNTDFYNIASQNSMEKIQRIHAMGHEIGLHFDETKYADFTFGGGADHIIEEANVMRSILKLPIGVVSMHRPTKATLEADLKIDGLINSYGYEFFKGFKYVSDSRRRWRENVEEIIDCGEYKRLHILTHAFWYHESEKDLKETICDFVNNANRERYHVLEKNITNLNEIMEPTEIIE